MLKTYFKRLVACYIAKRRNISFEGKTIVPFRTALDKFQGWNGTKDYPVLINNSTIIGRIMIGEGSKIYDSKISVGGGTLSIGKCVSLNNVYITQFINPITIGNYCSIAAGTRIIESMHIADRLTTYHYSKNILNKSIRDDIESKGSIEIEDDVWIGSNTVILSGVKIGRGSIIGAGSIVTHDVPQYTVVAGCPAKVIRNRFDSDELTSAIQESKWWEKTPEELRKEESLFTKRGIEILKFINNT